MYFRCFFFVFCNSFKFVVDAFQGAEKEVILISTSRTEAKGMLFASEVNLFYRFLG
jgi:hypothetical protein